MIKPGANEELQSDVYERVEETDFVSGMPVRRRHDYYLLKMQEGLAAPFFSYT